MGTLEDGACPHGEVPLTGVAAVITALAGRDAVASLALRADSAIRLEARFEIFSSGFCIGEKIEKFKSAYCASAHFVILTEHIIAKTSEGVKRIMKVFLP
jgi:hypothetical protein